MIRWPNRRCLYDRQAGRLGCGSVDVGVWNLRQPPLYACGGENHSDRPRALWAASSSSRILRVLQVRDDPQHRLWDVGMTVKHPRIQKQKLEEAAKGAVKLAIEGHPEVVSYTSPADWDEMTFFEVRIIRRNRIEKVP